jgi:hypothetical protein
MRARDVPTLTSARLLAPAHPTKYAATTQVPSRASLSSAPIPMETRAGPEALVPMPLRASPALLSTTQTFALLVAVPTLRALAAAACATLATTAPTQAFHAL